MAMKRSYCCRSLLYMLLTLNVLMLSGCTGGNEAILPSEKEAELQRRVVELERQLSESSNVKDGQARQDSGEAAAIMEGMEITKSAVGFGNLHTP